MASSSNSGDNENYWPGYVDALTTMTMVLTFIMMVLGVMVFMLSQDIVQSKLGLLSRVLRMEPRQLEKLAPGDIEAAMRRALAEKDAGGAGERPESGARGTVDGPSIGPLKAGDLARSGGTRMQGDGNDNGNPFRTTFDGGMNGDRSGGPGGEFFVADQGTGVAGSERGTGGRVETGPGALRFVFDRGAIDLPPSVTEALHAYVASEGAARLLVEAIAVANEGGPTEARRKAYFRAMIIRSRLIKLGVDPTQVSVRIRDASQLTALETVDVMRRAAGG